MVHNDRAITDYVCVVYSYNYRFRQHQTTRVDSRTLFTDPSIISSMNKEQEVIPAPPELSSISELLPDNTHHDLPHLYSNQTNR